MQTGAAHTQEDAQIPRGPAWVAGTAIRAAVVAGYIADKLLQRSLMSCLLAFVDRRSHQGGLWYTGV